MACGCSRDDPTLIVAPGDPAGAIHHSEMQMFPSMLATVLVALLASFSPAAAALCGGAVACACGDTVVASTTLAGDLGVCDSSGLRIRSGITLDCAGFTLTGSDGSQAKFGIEVDGAVGATVKNCKVTKFRRGIRINAGSGNALLGNESYANKYGIDLAGGTQRNVIKRNLVRINRDEGIHFGESHRNKLVKNTFSDNKRENVYLLRSNGNLIKGNLLNPSNAAAIFVKHSSRNEFVRNWIEDAAVQVRGDSKHNVFEGNYLKGNGYVFEAYQEPTGWTFPSGNETHGDCIRKTDFCYRFLGAFDNTATAARVDPTRCAPPDHSPVTLEPRGGQEATGNVVELADRTCNDDPSWSAGR
jgi:parallel beta-helix repeat protein